jgi:putative two-component system response regulator
MGWSRWRTASMAPIPSDARLLVVDDEPANVLLLERILDEAGYYNHTATTDPRQVLALYAQYDPDVVLLDLAMPHLDGFAVMEQLRQVIPAGTFLPILVLTADATDQAKQRALSDGATDFLVKPFDTHEVLLRIGNLLQTRRLHLEVLGHNQLLEQRVRDRTAQLEAAHNEILQRLALAAEYRDDETHQHTLRVGEASGLLGATLGLPETTVCRLRQAAPLHDIGKIGISDVVLLKPAKLTPEEFEHVKTHTLIGSRILADSPVPVLQLGCEIALTHHERWDGSGYPHGLRGERIPLSGRIVSVVDVFDALTHARPYKHAWPIDQAMAEITAQRGRQFDPEVVDTFLGLLEQGTLPAVGTLAPQSSANTIVP